MQKEGDLMIDVAIIGAGPAGLSAAINVAARNKRAVVFGRGPETSWIYKAESVNNHLGQPGMTGADMIRSYYEHARGLSIEMKEGRVLQALSMGDYFSLNFENEFYEAKALVFATGMPRSAALPGEKEYLGRGVSYCATCDGMLYRGKDVAVVAETAEGEEDAEFLSEICNNVYYLPAYPYVSGLPEKVQVITGKAVKVVGGEMVTGITTDADELSCQGVFFIKEAIPPESLIANLEMENKAIKVNRYMETNIPGVFAAGDCTGGPFQVSKAIGEGLVAGQQAVKYIR